MLQRSLTQVQQIPDEKSCWLICSSLMEEENRNKWTVLFPWLMVTFMYSNDSWSRWGRILSMMDFLILWIMARPLPLPVVQGLWLMGKPLGIISVIDTSYFFLYDAVIDIRGFRTCWLYISQTYLQVCAVPLLVLVLTLKTHIHSCLWGASSLEWLW